MKKTMQDMVPPRFREGTKPTPLLKPATQIGASGTEYKGIDLERGGALLETVNKSTSGGIARNRKPS